jgi:hypothetical protein
LCAACEKLQTLQDPFGYKGSIELSLSQNWKKENLAPVVLVAERNSHKITGVGASPLQA